MDENLPYAVGFSSFPGIGPKRYALLTSYFGSAKNAWEAPFDALVSTGMPVSLCSSFVRFRSGYDVYATMDRLNTKRVHVLSVHDVRYPALLREIADPPIVLYVFGKSRGNPIDMSRTIAVVGTRDASPYGITMCRRIVSGLVKYGITIVSGMARGIDTVAHWQAIESGGRTIAVLGSGIDIVSPPSNATVYRAIADRGGAVVTEMPLGYRPARNLFAVRNRIISGLSLGTVVIEGAEKSGTMITARYAAEQGRDVFAVPGPVTSDRSRGPAILIRNGAKLIESADDILAELDCLDKIR